MSLINREDTINYLMTNMNWHDEDGYTVEDAEEKRAIITDLINGVPDADDGWIPYTGQHIENGRYLVQIETSVIVCGTYSENGFVFPFCSDVIVAFRPLPKPYEPKEDK